MEVALINLPCHIDSDRSTTKDVRFFPEGLSMIAASILYAGHNVKIIDLSIDNNRIEDFSGVDVFGITAMINQFKSLKETISKLRNINPQAKIIIGGPLISSDPFLSGQYLDFDFGVIGEGEITVVELLKTIHKPEMVQGIAFRKQDGTIKLNPLRNFTQIENLPMPAFELFNLPWYLEGKSRPHLKKEKATLNNFMISRGCPFSCKFCFRLFGKKVRYKDNSRIIDELKRWKEAGVKFIRFQDDNFTLMPESKLERILEILKNFSLTWSCQGRVDSVNKKKLLQMKEAGLKIIYYGIESLSSDALKISGKGITLKKIREAIDWTLETGIKPATFLIVGLPGETKKGLSAMVKLVKDYNLLVTPYFLCPLPGTEFFIQAKKEGKISNEFLLKCQNWEENQVHENKIYVNLTGLPDRLLIDTYLELLEIGGGK